MTAGNVEEFHAAEQGEDVLRAVVEPEATAGRRGEAQLAVDRHQARMAELCVRPRDLLDTRRGS